MAILEGIEVQYLNCRTLLDSIQIKNYMSDVSQVYNKIEEVLNSESEGRITVLHFPNYEDMDAEVICGALEQFTAISSKHPKYLIIDNQDVLTHPCNGK